MTVQSNIFYKNHSLKHGSCETSNLRKENNYFLKNVSAQQVSESPEFTGANVIKLFFFFVADALDRQAMLLAARKILVRCLLTDSIFDRQDI